MITLISGTNRKDSRTRFVTDQIHAIVKQRFERPTHQINLDELSHDIYHPAMYSADGQHSALRSVQDEAIIPADLWIIVTPEYNGSFSGAIKLFIDALSVRKYADTFKGKKVALVGVAAGRAGNLRGMEHLTGLLNYLGMTVYPNKLPISSIEKVVEGEKLDAATTETLEKWVDGLGIF